MSEGFIQLGKVMVSTTENKGHDPEFWAERATSKICDISDNAPEHVRQQAHAFKNYIYQVILETMKNAIMSDRTTMINLLRNQGHKDMADIIQQFK
jgi:hypothetical protein|tara:strand:+ start:3005 stop:3292 length:288 start_codon:yes stop_codon:yes gene_type:complete